MQFFATTPTVARAIATFQKTLTDLSTVVSHHNGLIAASEKRLTNLTAKFREDEAIEVAATVAARAEATQAERLIARLSALVAADDLSADTVTEVEAPATEEEAPATEADA